MIKISSILFQQFFTSCFCLKLYFRRLLNKYYSGWESSFNSVKISIERAGYKFRPLGARYIAQG